MLIPTKGMTFHKALAKYYIKWYEDCIVSAARCNTKGYSIAAQEYLDDAARLKVLIEENREAIEFFSRDDNYGKKDSALPERFRGYK